MKKRIIVIAVIIIALLLGLRSCAIILDRLDYDKTRNTVYTSPNQKELLMRYDHLSRPSLFYNDKLIWKYEGNAFMETVYFQVTWISENEILLYEEMYDEEYTVFIP